MPQLQILNQSPSFGAQLGRNLGEGLGKSIGSKINSYFQDKKLQTIAPKLSEFLKETTGQDISPENLTAALNADFKPQNILDSLVKESQFKQQSEIKNAQSQQKEMDKLKSDEKSYKTFSDLLDNLQDLKKYAGSTYIPFTKSAGGHIKYSKAAQKRAQIQTTRLAFEGLFRDLTAKGQFPATIYERILKNLPDENDSERQFQGKIDAIRDILKAHFGQETKELKSIEKSKINPADFWG